MTRRLLIRPGAAPVVRTYGRAYERRFLEFHDALANGARPDGEAMHRLAWTVVLLARAGWSEWSDGREGPWTEDRWPLPPSLPDFPDGWDPGPTTCEGWWDDDHA